MRLNDSFWISTLPHQTWALLSDLNVIRDLLPKGLSIQPLRPGVEYALESIREVNGESLRLPGELLLSEIDTYKSATLAFDFKSREAGAVIGIMQVNLSPKDEGTRLAITLTAFASGTLDEGSGKRLEEDATQFVRDFCGRLQAHAKSVDRTPAPPSAVPKASGLKYSRFSWGVVLGVILSVIAYYLFVNRVV